MSHACEVKKKELKLGGVVENCELWVVSCRIEVRNRRKMTPRILFIGPKRVAKY